MLVPESAEGRNLPAVNTQNQSHYKQKTYNYCTDFCTYICSTVIAVALCEAWIASIHVLFTLNLSDITPEFFTVVMFVTN